MNPKKSTDRDKTLPLPSEIATVRPGHFGQLSTRPVEEQRFAYASLDLCTDSKPRAD